ncbi:MAG: A/G-specific adenine glycosylase [Candidatus Omnitrophica bacterium]|nr:A/G-specific adenine glycosylase [Candidatus Omnitrophota bacterium]
MKKELLIRRSILAWFRKNKRDLPWRKTGDPYAVWLSEIMLQQTRVETVIPYYNRFLKAYPTVHHLAGANEDHVLKLWEGLGYYRRALNLHQTAKIVAKDYEGVFPGTVDELQALPGIGRYTAGAIASIAFGVRAPVLDGNVKRVLSRLYAVKERIDRSDVLKRLWQIAGELVSPRSPGNFNQGIMELGARICLPQNPLCGGCPVKQCCEAFLHHCPQNFPVQKAKKTLPHYEVVAAAIYKRGRFLLGKRPPGGMLGGLWEFPGGKVEAGETHEQALKREIMEEMGIGIEIGEHVLTVDHGYSHYTVSIHLYRCSHIDGRPRALYHSEIKWTPKSQFNRYSFPAANIKFFEHL